MRRQRAQRSDKGVARAPLAVIEPPPGLPPTPTKHSMFNPREITLSRFIFNIVMAAMTSPGGRGVGKGGIVARRVGPNEVQLSWYPNGGVLKQEVITVPGEFVVRAYQSKIGG